MTDEPAPESEVKSVPLRQMLHLVSDSYREMQESYDELYETGDVIVEDIKRCIEKLDWIQRDIQGYISDLRIMERMFRQAQELGRSLKSRNE